MTTNEIEEVPALREAIRELDDLWDRDAASGFYDERGSDDYRRFSPVPALRRILTRMEAATDE